MLNTLLSWKDRLFPTVEIEEDLSVVLLDQASSPVKGMLEVVDRARLPLPKGARVLDFGCGAGREVYAYRDLGFEAYGFDIVKEVSLRCAGDAAWFAFHKHADETRAVSMLSYCIDSSEFTLPWPDGFFDAIFSNQVFEHIADHDPVLREMRRVLKPPEKGGFCVHIFPPRFRFIETHIRAPLGALLTKRW